MKNKIIIAAGAVLFAAAVMATVYEHRSRSAEDALFRANVEALTDVEVIAKDEYCVIFDYKNRFLAAGCKQKDTYTCTVKKVDLPNISLGQRTA